MSLSSRPSAAALSGALSRASSFREHLRDSRDELKELLKSCTYVEIRRLLELACVRHGASIAELVALFGHVKELRIGDTVPEAFFQNNFSEVMRVSKTLKYLDMSASKVCDDDLLKIGYISKLQKINLSSTAIDGKGLSGPVFISVKELQLSWCKDLEDEYLKHCSSTKLKKVDLSGTNINGIGLSGPAFVSAEELTVQACWYLRCGGLKYCPVETLEKMDFSWISSEKHLYGVYSHPSFLKWRSCDRNRAEGVH